MSDSDRYVLLPTCQIVRISNATHDLEERICPAAMCQGITARYRIILSYGRHSQAKRLKPSHRATSGMACSTGRQKWKRHRSSSTGGYRRVQLRIDRELKNVTRYQAQ